MWTPSPSWSVENSTPGTNSTPARSPARCASASPFVVSWSVMAMVESRRSTASSTICVGVNVPSEWIVWTCRSMPGMGRICSHTRCTRPPVRLLNHAPLAADHYCREGGRPRPSRRMLEPPPPPPGPMTGAALITGPDQTFRRFDGDHRATGGRAGRTTGLGLPVAITLVAVLVAGAVGAMAIPSGPAKAADLRLSLSPGRVLHYQAHLSMVARAKVGDVVAYPTVDLNEAF